MGNFFAILLNRDPINLNGIFLVSWILKKKIQILNTILKDKFKNKKNLKRLKNKIHYSSP